MQHLTFSESTVFLEIGMVSFFLDCIDNSMPSINSVFEYKEDIHIMPLSVNPSITDLETGGPNLNACTNYLLSNLSYFKTSYVLSINKKAESVCLVDLAGIVTQQL